MKGRAALRTEALHNALCLDNRIVARVIVPGTWLFRLVSGQLNANDTRIDLVEAGPIEAQSLVLSVQRIVQNPIRIDQDFVQDIAALISLDVENHGALTDAKFRGPRGHDHR